MRLPRIRTPRFRFTIGRLMVVVLLTAFALWGVFVVRPRLNPDALPQALARYKHSMLVREVAEYAVAEYWESIYVDKKLDPQTEWLVSHGLSTRDRLDVKEFKSHFRLELEKNLREAKLSGDAQVKLLLKDVETARADELARLKAYQVEQSRLWWWAFLGC